MPVENRTLPRLWKGSKGKGKGASGTHRGKGSKSSGRWRDRPGAESSGARTSTDPPPTEPKKTPGIPAKAYPGQTVWHPPQNSSSVMSTTSRPISYSPGDFTAEPAPEPEHEGSLGAGATASGHLGPDPVPKKARGPVGDTRPLAIVLPNG